MAPMHRLLMVALVALSLTLDVTPSDACSCMFPQSKLWSPSDGGPAPLNARITVLVPSYPGYGRMVLRPVGGSAVDVVEQAHDVGATTVKVLTPKQPLAADTRYELAMTARPQHPKTLVFGTFATGDTTDDKAPAFAQPTAIDYFEETSSRMTSCQSHERWLEIRQAAAVDARGHSTVLYGVWLSETGKPDLTAAPTWILPMEDGLLRIGARHMCSFLRPKLPDARKAQVAVAAFDDAGNRSAVHQLRVSMTR